MKPRIQPAPERAGIPGELLAFRVEDWDDGTPAPDDWGQGASKGISWRAFHAKLRWMHALADWQREHTSTGTAN